MSKQEEEREKLKWIQLREDMDQVLVKESTKDKIIRRCKENPFVPIGAVATVTAFLVGINSFRKGDKIMSQKMMRARVFAQSFTIVAMVGGVFFTATKKS
ncbi:HIG1 domain family member 2A, mitochondrial [Cephus cinctus]|uniref:HIG1 domain family member 2A, mitochondrial n=1 Tax=Cephus cinctus TaxID=211228 RepID=A0AAJ7BYS2_CEPCN|nr:HIG1 domain family member 2A, mitochondrial [Cephus cinctus]